MIQNWRQFRELKKKLKYQQRDQCDSHESHTLTHTVTHIRALGKRNMTVHDQVFACMHWSQRMWCNLRLAVHVFYEMERTCHALANVNQHSKVCLCLVKCSVLYILQMRRQLPGARGWNCWREIKWMRVWAFAAREFLFSFFFVRYILWIRPTSSASRALKRKIEPVALKITSSLTKKRFDP